MAMLARSSTASEPMRLLLLALLACAAAGASVCDMVNCAKGNCAELSELNYNFPPNLPPYECHCDPGWSHASEYAPNSPCMVPKCSFDGACLNLTLTAPPPVDIDVCSFVNCGAGGACKIDDANFLNYTCECKPGYANLLSLTALPCAKNNCSFGGCSASGLAPALAPVSQPSPPSTANNHDSSGPSAPRAGTNGSIPSRRLLQLLLLVTLAMAQLL